MILQSVNLKTPGFLTLAAVLILGICTPIFASELPADEAMRACSGLLADETQTQMDLYTGVVNLPSGSLIPEEIYDNFEINEIAEAIVERHRLSELERSEELKSFESERVDLFGDADIIVYFDSTNAHLILEDRFKNQHETGTSRGIFNPSGRLRTEDFYTGIKMGTHPQAMKLRPKSGFFNVRTNVDLSRKESTGNHGDMGAVLKSNLKRRALWFDSDSDMFGNQDSVDTFFRNILQYRGTFFRTHLPKEGSLVEWYQEAVVYGDITPNDIDYLLVSPSRTRKMLKDIASYGIPIYTYKKVKRNRRVVVEKDKLLFDGVTLAPRPPFWKTIGSQIFDDITPY